MGGGGGGSLHIIQRPFSASALFCADHALVLLEFLFFPASLSGNFYRLAVHAGEGWGRSKTQHKLSSGFTRRFWPLVLEGRGRVHKGEMNTDG